MKSNTRYFDVKEQQVVVSGVQLDLIHIWLGPPDHPESERIMTIGRKYVPALIATLRRIKSNGKHPRQDS